MTFPAWLAAFLKWRSKHIKDRQFVLFLSVVIGFLSGLVAVVLKNTVHLIEWILDLSYLGTFQYFLY
ncbi:MAG: chloride channel protein, partial [Bacteroidota bacterium]